LQPAEAWQSLPDGGAVLRIEFTSENARGLRLQLRGELNGLELRVYDPTDHSAFGPYTFFPGVWEEGEEPTWWTPTIDGTSIGLEYFQKEPNQAPLPEVAAVGYLYDDVVEDELLGGTCILDVTCFAAWANEAAGVGRMLFQEGTSFFLCSGAMLNRNPADPGGQQSPVFLTARHCIHDQPAANSLEVRWFYQSDVCNGPVPDLSTRPRNNGSLLLKLHHDSDGSLIGLYERTRAGYLLGWNSAYLGNNSSITGIHHPGGRPKKIHFGTKPNDTTCFTADHAVESNEQYYVTMTLGAARRGSSGSPLLDTNHAVRGTMSCGPGGDPEPLTCPPNEFKTYGRLFEGFTNIRYYIFQMANPAYADLTFAGDPGQDGDRERGTLSNPFTTVYKATFEVPTSGTVFIRSGVYHEGNITLWRPMTLRARLGPVEIRR
jgi:hypothetical protein